MLEPLVGEERRPRAAALEQRVRGDGRAVCEALDPRRSDGSRRRQHGFLLPEGTRNLRRPYAPVVEEHRVRERPADIDAQDRHVRTLHRRADPRLPLRLRRADRRHRVGLARGLAMALPRARSRAAAGEVGARGRHRRRLGPDGAPPGARRRAARAEGAARTPVRTRAVVDRSRAAPPRHRRLPRRGGAARAQTRDRLELVAPVDRHAPAAPRASRRLGRDRRGRRRPGAAKPAPRSISRRSTCSGCARTRRSPSRTPRRVRAARAAGIFVVGIPNAVTRDLGLDEADLVLESLAELSPDELLARFP